MFGFRKNKDQDNQIDQRPVNEDTVRRAAETLSKYQSAKSNLDEKIVQNEEWWKLRTWDKYRHGDKKDAKKRGGSASRSTPLHKEHIY